MKKRFSAFLLAALMVAALLPTAGFAADPTTKTVGAGKDYATLTEAMAAVNSVTGDVVLEIYGKHEYAAGTKNMKGAYDKLSFVGKDADAEIQITRTGGGAYLQSSKTVSFANLKLSKANPKWENNAGHMGHFFSIQGGTTEYTNCVFPNGACTSTGTAVYNNCSFENTAYYGLWVYDDALVTVNGGKVDSVRGIKVYSEGETSVTSTLTVENATFTDAITEKGAVCIGYAQSVTLIGNTWNNVAPDLELDSGSDADCEGVAFEAKDAEGNDIANELEAVDRANSSAACGVLITDASGNTKIYTSVAEAKEDAQSGDTVTLLHNTTEAVQLPDGVQLDENGFTAENVEGDRVPPPAYAGPVMNWVKVNTADNGVVKSGPLAASAGATVTLYPKAAEGFVLDTVEVLDAEGNAVELDGLKFAIPAGGVTVNATFKLAE